MPDEKKDPKKEPEQKIRSERFYEDDPESAFTIVKPGKKDEEKPKK